MNNIILNEELIKSKIYTIRNKRVMLDRDLAKLYCVETRVLKQTVRRNLDRFPNLFMFEMTNLEFSNWRSQFVMSNSDNLGLRHKPFCFTEQGVAMLSAVLKSKIAIDVSISIINAFVELRKSFSEYSNFFVNRSYFENKISEYDNHFKKIFNAIENNEIKQGIFYNGEVFDARKFVMDLIKKSNKFHDRFLIIDKEVYLFGASIKDLGKKIFGFSNLDGFYLEIINKLKTL